MPYEFLDDIATADIAFSAWGETIEEMMGAAADATMNTMVADLGTISEREERVIDLHSDSIEMLMFGLLQEVIYFKDAEQLLLRIKEIAVNYADGLYAASAVAWGEAIDPQKHDFIVDVKAVTLHRFTVEQTQRGWEALVVLDV
ncbi:MAG: archease [Desulfobacteraceae bacterium]|nr:archease [Desulfobacteraceae bacterium]